MGDGGVGVGAVEDQADREAGDFFELAGAV
jgi:hypothetical protein